MNLAFPKKLISLTEICMNRNRNRNMHDWAQTRDALSPLLFNIALEKMIHKVQSNKLGISIGKTTLDVLGFAGNLNLMGENKNTVVENTKTLIREAKKIGLEVNGVKNESNGNTSRE